MKKKVISSFIAALMIAGTTSFTAFATMANGSIVIGSKSFDLAYANDIKNSTEITNAIIGGGVIYVKDFSGNWIDNTTGKTVDAGIVPGENKVVVMVTVKTAIFGAEVTATSNQEGATQYQIFDGTNHISAIAKLGTNTTIFPAKVVGDTVIIKLLNAGGTIVTTTNVTLVATTTPVVTAPIVTTPIVTNPVVTTPVITTPVITTPVVTTNELIKQQYENYIAILLKKLQNAQNNKNTQVMSQNTDGTWSYTYVADASLVESAQNAYDAKVLEYKIWLSTIPTTTPVVTTPIVTTPIVTNPVVTTPIVTTPVINDNTNNLIKQQYENDIANLLKKLQNAQNNKTTQTLTKGTDGTWSYTYVADASLVESAQNAYDAKVLEYKIWLSTI